MDYTIELKENRIELKEDFGTIIYDRLKCNNKPTRWYRVQFYDEKGIILNEDIVSQRYIPVITSSVINLLKEILEDYKIIEKKYFITSNGIINYYLFFDKLILKQNPFEFLFADFSNKIAEKMIINPNINNDEMYFGLQISNSYNGKSLLNIYLTLFRLVCENGLIIRRLIATEGEKHIGDKIKQFIVKIQLEKEIKKIKKMILSSLVHVSPEKINEILTSFMIPKRVQKQIIKPLLEKYQNQLNKFILINLLSWISTHYKTIAYNPIKKEKWDEKIVKILNEN